jgi:hypothetical protein
VTELTVATAQFRTLFNQISTPHLLCPLYRHSSVTHEPASGILSTPDATIFHHKTLQSSCGVSYATVTKLNRHDSPEAESKISSTPNTVACLGRQQLVCDNGSNAHKFRHTNSDAHKFRHTQIPENHKLHAIILRWRATQVNGHSLELFSVQTANCNCPLTVPTSVKLS